MTFALEFFTKLKYKYEKDFNDCYDCLTGNIYFLQKG